ncbi:MAG: hypothetical protein IPF78_04135 [Flavobacteriales bacterium]|nr:hypothetical protein [Flavobacteriales bacterium]
MHSIQHSSVQRIGVIGVATTLFFLLACSSSRKSEAPTAPPAAETVRIVKGDPPAKSELAQLMREMTAFADTTGKRLSEGRDLLPFPEQFKKLKTAEATPGMVDRGTFDPFAQAWLHQLDSLYTTPKADRTNVFNDLIMACAGCHGQMCPGPLVRINKLSIPEDGE